MHQLDKSNQENQQSSGDEDLALPLFDSVTMSTATDEFSFTNKIGEGGFGSVYKVETLEKQSSQVSYLSCHYMI